LRLVTIKQLTYDTPAPQERAIAEESLIFFTVTDFQPSAKRKVATERATTTPLLATDVAIQLLRCVTGSVQKAQAGEQVEVTLSRCRNAPPMLLRWGTLFGERTTLRNQLLHWTRGASHVTVDLEGHPDGLGADDYVVRLLLEAKAHPRGEGTLNVSHAGPDAGRLLGVLEGILSQTGCVERLGACHRLGEASSTWTLTQHGYNKVQTSVVVSNPSLALQEGRMTDGQASGWELWMRLEAAGWLPALAVNARVQPYAAGGDKTIIIKRGLVPHRFYLLALLKAVFVFRRHSIDSIKHLQPLHYYEDLFGGLAGRNKRRRKVRVRARAALMLTDDGDGFDVSDAPAQLLALRDLPAGGSVGAVADGVDAELFDPDSSDACLDDSVGSASVESNVESADGEGEESGSSSSSSTCSASDSEEAVPASSASKSVKQSGSSSVQVVPSTMVDQQPPSGGVQTRNALLRDTTVYWHGCRFTWIMDSRTHCHVGWEVNCTCDEHRGNTLKCVKRHNFKRHNNPDVVERRLKWWLLHAVGAATSVEHRSMNFPLDSDLPTWEDLENLARQVLD
jgi:hypothetical protein